MDNIITKEVNEQLRKMVDGGDCMACRLQLAYGRSQYDFVKIMWECGLDFGCAGKIDVYHTCNERCAK